MNEKNRAEFIVNEVIEYRNNINNERELELKLQNERITKESERQKSILEKSGVREIFEGIKKNGKIRLSNEPLKEITLIHRDGQVIQEKERTISDYTPAEIYISEYAPPNINLVDPGLTPASIALRYNKHKHVD